MDVVDQLHADQFELGVSAAEQVMLPLECAELLTACAAVHFFSRF
jgi:hypothetical protein